MASTTQARAGWELPLAVGSGIAVAVGAVWITLIEHGVTVSPSPPVSDGWVSSELEAWYAWWATTLPQNRIALVVLIIGLVGAAITAVRAAGPAWASRAGAVVMAGAVATWCLGDLAQAGAQRAVEQMAAYGNPIEAVASIAYTVDVATSWVEAGAAIALGLGALAMGLGFRSERRHRLAVHSGLLGVAGVAFGVMTISPDVDAMISAIAVGVVLLPTWLVAVVITRTRSEAAPVDPLASPTVTSGASR